MMGSFEYFVVGAYVFFYFDSKIAHMICLIDTKNKITSTHTHRGESIK